MNDKYPYEDVVFKHRPRRNFTLEDEMSLQSLAYPTTLHSYMNERTLAEHPEND